MDKNIKKLKTIFNKSRHIVVLTGAGLSAESGIPTYRGSGGLWTKYDPMIYANINYFLNDPSYYWSFFRDVRYKIIKDAKPNSAHFSLVKLEKEKKIDHVITQNIDGLHKIAGQLNVIELHGNTREIICIKCKKTLSIDEVYKLLKFEFPPKCKNCSELLRPNTVFFGESIPNCKLDEAINVSKNCDLFLVLGSSLVVSPASYLSQIAKENEASLVIVNIDPTPFDHTADIVIHDRVSKILTNLTIK